MQIVIFNIPVEVIRKNIKIGTFYKLTLKFLLNIPWI